MDADLAFKNTDDAIRSRNVEILVGYPVKFLVLLTLKCEGEISINICLFFRATGFLWASSYIRQFQGGCSQNEHARNPQFRWKESYLHIHTSYKLESEEDEVLAWKTSSAQILVISYMSHYENMNVPRLDHIAAYLMCNWEKAPNHPTSLCTWG